MSGPEAHTPGTWAVVQPEGDFDNISVCAFDGDPADGIMADVIAEVISIKDEADARLIAAAPDLLAFVRQFAKRNPVFAKGAEKTVISDALALVAKAVQP